MAKRLTTQARIKRARAEGFSRKQLAQAFGVSVSAVGRAERGQTSGATIEAQAKQFFGLGKRAKANIVSGSIPLPSAKLKSAPRSKGGKAPAVRIVSPLEKAEGYLSQLSGDAMVLVRVMTSDRSVRVYYARGGIEASEIKGNLYDSIESQTDRQYSGDGLDWADVVDITIEEY